MTYKAYIKKGAELYDENTGTLYVIQKPHFSDYLVTCYDNYDEETQKYVNPETTILTSMEVKHLLNAKYLCWVGDEGNEEEDDEE